MSLSLGLDADQVMIADAVRRLCADRLGAPAEFSRALWRELAALGVLALGGPAGEQDGNETGGAEELAAAAEELGRAGFPGPLAATIMASRLLPAHLGAPLRAGERLVALGEAPLLPWGMEADVFIDLADGSASLLDVSAREPVATLGGECWARVTARPLLDLGPAREARLWHDIALGAQLVGAGLGLVEAAAAHATQRRQFGKTIASFQGVSFPLAQAVVALESAQLLVRAAAVHVQRGSASRRRLTLSARLSAGRAARQAAFSVHQVFGALGATADGPAFSLSRRIQQWTVQAPSDRDAWSELVGLDADTATILIAESSCNSN